MNESHFAAAARPARCNILKLPMADYSIGHELLLQAQGNALLLPPPDFASLPATEQVAALIRAVFICCRSWEENRQPLKWVRLWCWLRRKENFPLAIAEFRNYRAQGSTFPVTVEPDGKSRALGGPYMARLLGFAAERFGVAAFDQPLGLLQFMYFSHSESQGDCEIENDNERETREQIERIEADYKKEQEAKNGR